MSTAEAVQAAAILALLVVLEGVRRLAERDTVLHRLPWTCWSVQRAARIGRGFFVVSWLVPLDVPLVLRAEPARRSSDADGEPAIDLGRLERVRRWVLALQLNGTLVALLFVVGVPYAAWRKGGFGFLVAVTLLFVATVAQATLARLALARADADPRPFLRWLWPTTAIRAAEAVQAAAVDGVPALLTMHALLGEEALLEAHRAPLYDLGQGGADDDGARVTELLGADRVREFLRRVPPLAADEAFCPRCACRYRAEISSCDSCAVSLVVGAGAASRGGEVSGRSA